MLYFNNNYCICLEFNKSIKHIRDKSNTMKGEGLLIERSELN